jgi:hypothetical protein
MRKTQGAAAQTAAVKLNDLRNDCASSGDKAKQAAADTIHAHLKSPQQINELQATKQRDCSEQCMTLHDSTSTEVLREIKVPT